MEIEDKLETLVGAAQFDVCGYSGMRAPGPSPLRFIYRAALPGGGSVCLFKVLLTNVCTNDCAYCVNRTGRDIRRTSFQPDELARLFMQLYDRRLVRGLFLSSGVAANASRTMESMVKTVEILRHRYDFKGYIHLKILPGATFDCVEAGCRLATRVSVNMEAPTAEYLARHQGLPQELDGLTPDHWRIIDYMRSHFHRTGATPSVHEVCSSLMLTKRQFISLFPNGLLMARRIAGLPGPRRTANGTAPSPSQQVLAGNWWLRLTR